MMKTHALHCPTTKQLETEETFVTSLNSILHCCSQSTPSCENVKVRGNISKQHSAIDQILEENDPSFALEGIFTLNNSQRPSHAEVNTSKHYIVSIPNKATLPSMRSITIQESICREVELFLQVKLRFDCIVAQTLRPALRRYAERNRAHTNPFLNGVFGFVFDG